MGVSSRAGRRSFGGRVLTAGGIDGSSTLTALASVLDPATGAWAPIASLPGPGAPVHVQLDDGTVLAIASRARTITSAVYRIAP